MTARAVTLCFALALAWTLAAPARAAETPIPPSPTQWVTDTAGFMSPQAAQALNARLRNYERTTGHQILVYIGRTTGGPAIEEWAVHAFEKWKIGRKELDDGVLLVIMADDHKLRFEVGYGLEGDVPDVVASRIIRDIMVPRISAGRRDEAVTAGIDAMIGVIGGEKSVAEHRRPHAERGPSLGQKIIFLLGALIFLFILVTNPSLALYMLWAISSGGRGGGYGGGYGGRGGDRDGGGFSGGGGRSGGGGASGSW